MLKSKRDYELKMHTILTDILQNHFDTHTHAFLTEDLDFAHAMKELIALNYVDGIHLEGDENCAHFAYGQDFYVTYRGMSFIEDINNRYL